MFFYKFNSFWDFVRRCSRLKEQQQTKTLLWRPKAHLSGQRAQPFEYRGAWPCNALYVKSKILKSVLKVTGSQWRDAVWSTFCFCLKPPCQVRKFSCCHLIRTYVKAATDTQEKHKVNTPYLITGDQDQSTSYFKDSDRASYSMLLWGEANQSGYVSFENSFLLYNIQHSYKNKHNRYRDIIYVM